MRWIFSLMLLLSSVHTTLGDGIAREIVRQGGKVLLREGAEQTAKRAAKETAEVAVKRLATQTTASSARRAAATAARHFGDDLVRAGSKFSDDLAKASARLTGQQQRRMAMMAKNMSPTAKRSMMSRVASSTKPGALIDDLWRHKYKLAAGAAAITVIAHGDDLAKAGGEFVAKPMIESVMAPMANALVSTALSMVWFVPPIAAVVGVAFYFQHRLILGVLRSSLSLLKTTWLSLRR